MIRTWFIGQYSGCCKIQQDNLCTRSYGRCYKKLHGILIRILQDALGCCYYASKFLQLRVEILSDPIRNLLRHAVQDFTRDIPFFIVFNFTFFFLLCLDIEYSTKHYMSVCNDQNTSSTSIPEFILKLFLQIQVLLLS